ncbi:DUF2690 domain-containing protein [Streptomyces mirabilis]|uniref:DUF2690 domain-containing protein n=1 Tax=Streptomyces mirabilis TaxID=68239 RepID=UPI0039A7381D
MCALAAVLVGHRWGGDHAPVPQGAPAGAPTWPWPLHSTASRSGPPCGPVGCRGLDPYRQRCDQDAVTVHRLRALGRTLTLRWSPACHAGWAEVQPTQGTSIAAGRRDRRSTADGARGCCVDGDDPRRTASRCPARCGRRGR